MGVGLESEMGGALMEAGLEVKAWVPRDGGVEPDGWHSS